MIGKNPSGSQKGLKELPLMKNMESVWDLMNAYEICWWQKRLRMYVQAEEIKVITYNINPLKNIARYGVSCS